MGVDLVQWRCRHLPSAVYMINLTIPRPSKVLYHPVTYAPTHSHTAPLPPPTLHTSSLYFSSTSLPSTRSLGSVMVRSSAYGRPLCRPRIIIAQMTTLLNTLKCPLSDVALVGYPSDRPTLAYPDTTSKKMEKTEKAWLGRSVGGFLSFRAGECGAEWNEMEWIGNSRGRWDP